MKLVAGILAVSLAIVGCSSAVGAGRVATPGSPTSAWPASATDVLPSNAGTSLDPTASASGDDESPSSVTPAPSEDAASLAQLIGQKLIVRMAGTYPTASLLGRIRRGEVGGVVLFGSNIETPSALMDLTRALREAAAAGGQPSPLIAIDQEGGSIRRVTWAGPTLTTSQMGARGSPSIARAQGEATGLALRQLGINVDLAPVADVPASEDSFMYLEGRTWSLSVSTTTSLANAFALGLESENVVPVMKHFPGLGFASQDTDSHAVTLEESIAALAPGLRPYREAISEGIPMIMLSNATYDAYDPLAAAGWSHAIGTSLLRETLGFSGVTVTDSLTGAAAARGVSPGELAVGAAEAGVDMIMVTGSESSTRGVYATLLDAAEDGRIDVATLRDSYDRILALKARI